MVKSDLIAITWIVQGIDTDALALKWLADVKPMIGATRFNAVVGVQRGVQVCLAWIHAVCLIDLFSSHMPIDLIFVRLTILVYFHLSCFALVRSLCPWLGAIELVCHVLLLRSSSMIGKVFKVLPLNDLTSIKHGPLRLSIVVTLLIVPCLLSVVIQVMALIELVFQGQRCGSVRLHYGPFALDCIVAGHVDVAVVLLWIRILLLLVPLKLAREEALFLAIADLVFAESGGSVLVCMMMLRVDTIITGLIKRLLRCNQRFLAAQR